LGDRLNILMLSAEVAPFAKTGGVADVVGALPKALHSLGHDVRVVMPRYGRMHVHEFGLREVVGPFNVPIDGGSEAATLLQGSIPAQGGDVPIYFVEQPRLYDRDGIYMYPDDAERFVFFCRAALEGMRALDWKPDVVHTHDWHTAIIPNWLKTIYADDPFWRDTATLYTIHNLAYQGIFGQRVLELADLAAHGFITHPYMPHLNDVVNFMGRGIYFADMINTVSETYAHEILTPQYGEGLDPLLRDRRDRLFGVLNGIDDEVYNPQSDPYIAAPYHRADLTGKRTCAQALRARFGLEQRNSGPIIGMISRLTDVKGLDLVAAVCESILRHTSAQFVIVGTGDQKYHDLFESLRRRYRGRVGLELGFSEEVTHVVYAGSDMYLMPSRLEPCGLNQLISLRYGTVPIVRATGGLADTVEDWQPEAHAGNGFVVQQHDQSALFATLIRAIETHKYHDVWRELMLRGMSADHSWERAARRYVDLYERAIAARRTQSGREHR
jgi:starch synthase